MTSLIVARMPLIVLRTSMRLNWYYVDPDPVCSNYRYRFSQTGLADLKPCVDRWLLDHCGSDAFVKSDNEQLPLMTNADWVIALLRFGP